MAPIADSEAFKDRKRVLPQHQAALTILEGRLTAPRTRQISWLDLACGRGQILVSLDENLSSAARAKIKYCAYDLSHDFARETSRMASKLGFASFESVVGDLSDFDRLLPPQKLYDFITLTNTVHEIAPDRLSTLLVDSVGRLTNSGVLYIYDMERIKPPELGAIPWSRDDVRDIIYCMLNAIGVRTYRPEIARWAHTTCHGWSAHLYRQYIEVGRSATIENRDQAIKLARAEIARLLRVRLKNCTGALESLTSYGAETAEEQEDRDRLLFEFWALSRALEHAS